ncbi:aldose 1-epimerase family protein [Herbiconiux moechotypicola]|uniref:Aldose 1-epimerase family protein n=1 Tax=Herbiconiux moechotypicola TaxID=637393 RepID=A0ABP5QEZ8_9MICO|nr:aldose 1-epimerase family protein [Herbiconiux moechotypicola]MCS5732052.1 aldose 1-epimerase family protein [Herbiconiux moechotypicola]
MNIFGNEIDRAELEKRTGDLSAVAGIRQVVLDNGVERGVRAIDLRTSAGLELEVLVDRAFDLGSARFRGAPLGWRSGNGFRHPGLHEHSDEGGLSWLRALDGLLVSGGLDHTLFGGEIDATRYAYPPKQSVTHGLHGRLTAIPARLLEAREVPGAHPDAAPVLRVVGEVVQATSFGEHLRLTRTIELDFDGREIRLHDVVDNLGFEPTPHMFLYHLNIGWPYIDEGTEFVAPIAKMLWASDSASQQGVSYRTLPEPQLGFVEQVYEHELVAGPDGRHRVALLAPDGSRGVEVTWKAEGMPHFFEWQNLRSGQYAVGLEPSTHHVAGDGAARDDGSMTFLEHGESREYSTTIRVLGGEEETSAARAAIRALHGQPD